MSTISPFPLSSTGLGFQLRCHKMGRSTLLFITLTVSFSTLWSLIQTSQALDNSDSIRMTRSTGRSNNATDILYSERSDSVEGSGDTVDSMISQKILNQTVLTKEPERADNENHSRFRVTLATSEFSLPHLGAHDQGADKAQASSKGHAHSSVHIISEEALLEGSHITTEEQLKESHTTIVNDDFVTGE